jgi:hypothetical protein
VYARVTNLRFPPEMGAEVSEAGDSYRGQMSMMSSYFHEPLVPTTYEVDGGT